jgi:hypothetical protein
VARTRIAALEAEASAAAATASKIAKPSSAGWQEPGSRHSRRRPSSRSSCTPPRPLRGSSRIV